MLEPSIFQTKTKNCKKLVIIVHQQNWFSNKNHKSGDNMFLLNPSQTIVYPDWLLFSKLVWCVSGCWRFKLDDNANCDDSDCDDYECDEEDKNSDGGDICVDNHDCGVVSFI